MPHQIAADAFLEALDLPSEHPYVQPKGNIVEAKQEWSISSYFNSWKDSQSSTNSIETNECEKFPSPSWSRKGRSQSDAYEDVCLHSSVAAPNQFPANNWTEIDFLQEIQPCLISMFHMNLLLWAPLVIIVCVKKLYFQQKMHIHRQEPDSVNLTSGEPKSPAKTPSYSIPLQGYMPSLRKAAMAHDKQRRRTPEPCQNNTSFERLLLLLSLFLNAITVMASFSAIFSIEEKKKEADKPNEKTKDAANDHSKIFHRLRCNSRDDTMTQGPFLFTSEWVAFAVALVFTAVVMNDAMYVLAFPQSNLVALHLFVIYLSLKRFGTKVALTTALPITTIAFYIMAHQDLDLPTIEPGLYYDETNPFISEAINGWPVNARTYEEGTQWMMTGDTRTGLPFMVNKIPEQQFVRRWVPLPEEKEAIILDIAFPDNMVVNDDKRVYLVLHGINGDSNEGYVVDFVHRQVSQGNVVAVMVTRGLGESTIVGENILHFARTSDVSAAARALKKAINQVSPSEGLLLAGVGYSMGAITLANYVASNPNCDLDVAIAFSGALDTTQQVNFQRSAYLWQPFIAKAMRDTLLSRYSRQIARKLSEEQLKEVMKAKSLIDFDRALFVPMFGFDSLDDYYFNMGAMGDFELNGYEGRIANVSVPLLCIQSLDDPIGYWKTFRDPIKVSKSGNGNTILLFTQTGGHVGWPLGWNPSLHGWRWMSDAASSFAESVDKVRRVHAYSV